MQSWLKSTFQSGRKARHLIVFLLWDTAGVPNRRPAAAAAIYRLAALLLGRTLLRGTVLSIHLNEFTFKVRQAMSTIIRQHVDPTWMLVNVLSSWFLSPSGLEQDLGGDGWEKKSPLQKNIVRVEAREF